MVEEEEEEEETRLIVNGFGELFFSSNEEKSKRLRSFKNSDKTEETEKTVTKSRKISRKRLSLKAIERAPKLFFYNRLAG